jgi:hypothetical protein
MVGELQIDEYGANGVMFEVMMDPSAKFEFGAISTLVKLVLQLSVEQQQK